MKFFFKDFPTKVGQKSLKMVNKKYKHFKNIENSLIFWNSLSRKSKSI